MQARVAISVSAPQELSRGRAHTALVLKTLVAAPFDSRPCVRRRFSQAIQLDEAAPPTAQAEVERSSDAVPPAAAAAAPVVVAAPKKELPMSPLCQKLMALTVRRQRRGWARPSHICTGTGLAPPTSAPGLGSPLSHLHRDWAPNTGCAKALAVH